MRMIKLNIVLILVILVVGIVLAQDGGGDGTMQLPEESISASATPDIVNGQMIQGLALPINTDAIYTIRPRDTLDTIGALFDVSVACLLETNPGALDRDFLIHPDDQLLISIDCPPYDGVNTVLIPRPNAPGRAVGDNRYVVRPDDTLDGIAQKFDVSLDALKLANEITDGRTLAVGDVLVIPQDALSYNNQPKPAPEVEQDYIGMDFFTGVRPLVPGKAYKIQIGDTLSSISTQFGVDIPCIMVANEIPNTRSIFVGQVIGIPDEADCPQIIFLATYTATPTPLPTATPTATLEPTATATATNTPVPESTEEVSPDTATPAPEVTEEVDQ